MEGIPMNESDARRVNLRIRFAGLNLFVPHRTRGHVHVLLPDTSGHTAHHQTDQVQEHEMCLYWLSERTKQSASLAGQHLVLKHDAWPAVERPLPEVFDLRNVPAPANCAAEKHGKVDLGSVSPAASLVLHSGWGKLVNPGGRWKIGGQKYPMPTVMDWWVHGIQRSELMEALGGWTLLRGKMPDVGKGNTVNLWIIHAPVDEQDPGQIGSKPVLKPGPAHFPFYYTLLSCRGYDAQPGEPEEQDDPGDFEAPEWPDKRPFIGAFLNCMLAKAEMTVSSTGAE
jgi:hypothetical protein